MHAREPDYEGTVERDGVRVGYSAYGAGEPTIVLLTSWAITHAQQWKGQVPYLARHFRVITVEGRGNGWADRPGTEEAYSGVRSLRVLMSRRRAVSPVAASSARAISDHGSAPRRSNTSIAARSCSRARTRCRSRRRRAP